jgi:hypothetical protein
VVIGPYTRLSGLMGTDLFPTENPAKNLKKNQPILLLYHRYKLNPSPFSSVLILRVTAMKLEELA